MSDKLKELAEERVGKLLWKFYLPSFVGVIANALYNIIDRIFIGQGVGSMALTGLSVVFPIMIIIMAFGMLIGIGSGVFISINLGKGDKLKAERVLGNGFLLMLITSLIVTVFGFLIKTPLLNLFGATAETKGYAQDYLDIILLGTVFQMVGFSMNNIIRSEGNAKVAMYSMLISAGTNAILAPIFVFGFGWGVKGAAWATVLSTFILMIWVLMHFTSKRSLLKLRWENMKPDRKVIMGIVGIGMAPFSMQLAASVIQGIYNVKLIHFGGDIAVGAMGIINSVSIIIIMSIVALNMASQPIVGYNYGAKAYGRVRQTLFLCLKSATIISIVAWVVILLFSGSIIKVFNHNDFSLYEIGKHGLKAVLTCLPIVGFQVIASNFFQSVGRVKTAMLLSVLRQVLILVPLLLILPYFWGIDGVWYAGPTADFISAMIVLFYITKEWKRLRLLEQGRI
ncbi:MAG: MATE family efflux transporter [Bacteroidota bacterium]|nr:MATE family efflux transporter [Bacteroidota bacterium]MDP4205678.1 MATE family efflux transporter [Bacteroidota bacterium]